MTFNCALDHKTDTLALVWGVICVKYNMHNILSNVFIAWTDHTNMCAHHDYIMHEQHALMHAHTHMQHTTVMGNMHVQQACIPSLYPLPPMCSDQHLCQVYKNVMWIFPSCACCRRHSHCCRHVRNVVHVKFHMHRSPFLPLVGPLGVCGNTDSPYR